MVVTRVGAERLVGVPRDEVVTLASLFERLSDGTVLEEDRIQQPHQRAFEDCDTPVEHFRSLGRWPLWE
jgi:hypothetical protein